LGGGDARWGFSWRFLPRRRGCGWFGLRRGDCLGRCGLFDGARSLAGQPSAGLGRGCDAFGFWPVGIGHGANLSITAPGRIAATWNSRLMPSQRHVQAIEPQGSEHPCHAPSHGIAHEDIAQICTAICLNTVEVHGPCHLSRRRHIINLTLRHVRLQGWRRTATRLSSNCHLNETFAVYRRRSFRVKSCLRLRD